MDDKRLKGSPVEQGSARTARKNLPPYRDRLVFIKDGQEVLPGVHAIHTPRHTIGHTAYVIASSGKSVCFIDDIARHVILFENPRIEVNFDTDPKQGVETRVKLFEKLASERIPLMVYHMARYRTNSEAERQIPLRAKSYAIYTLKVPQPSRLGDNR
jgi:glyoxylase-like metal-dependent hydrolase (beta-lactamase superfamily II)